MSSASASRPESALELLYRKYDRLVRWVLRAAGAPESALDDLAHDVFLAIHRRLDDRDPQVPVRQWVVGVARNVAFSDRRARARELQRVQRLAPPADPARPDEILEAHEAWRALSGFLARLSPKQREVFVMVEVTGMRISELAETTGELANTLRSRLRLARGHFGRHFPGDAVEHARVLRRARAQARPSPGHRRRTWGLVVASVGGSTKLAPASFLIASTGVRSGWAWLWPWPNKAVAAVALVGSLAAVAAVFSTAEPAEAVTPSHQPRVEKAVAARPAPTAHPTAASSEGSVEIAAAPASASVPVPATLQARRATTRPPRARLRTKTTATTDADSAMSTAVQAIARARRELAAERPEAALTTLDSDAARFAPLDRERQRLALEAACALGRTSRANKARQALGDGRVACPQETQSP